MSNKIILEITISHDEDIDECIDAKDFIIGALDNLELAGAFEAVQIGAVLFQGVWIEEDIIIA
jgi:hypothetical protein